MAKYICLFVSFFLFTKAIQAQDSTVAQLAGKYKFPDGSVISEVNVLYENGALTMSSAVGSSALEKEAEDVYIIVAYQGKAVFKRDTNKKVIGVSITAMGYQLEGVKEISSIQFVLPQKQITIPLLSQLKYNF